MTWKIDSAHGWGRVLASEGRFARPERASHLKSLMAEAPCPAVGGLRSYGDAALNSGGDAIRMERMNRLASFDAETGVLEAEAGITISELLKVFAPRGWMPAVVPGTGFATLGGCIANDVHGKNHHEAGSFGQHVLSLRLIGPDGTARTISPKKSARLFAATIGGLGQTGIIESAKIQMLPCPALSMDVRERRMDSLAEFLAAFEASTADFSVGWVDATALGTDLGRGVLEEAAFTERASPFYKQAKSKRIPMDAPGFALSGPVVKLFNAGYFRRVPEAGRTRTRPLHDFFFPLDRLHDWNRLYGKRGFHQFQCVLPEAGAAMALERMLKEIATSGLASPLVVLKKMGPGRAGPLSFPMEGYTLAVDFPNRPRVPALLNRLEEQTVAAGGRIYFAKDSLMRAEHVAQMYPELDAWCEAVAKADPEGAFETDLVRRLKLRGQS